MTGTTGLFFRASARTALAMRHRSLGVGLAPLLLLTAMVFAPASQSYAVSVADPDAPSTSHHGAFCTCPFCSGGSVHNHATAGSADDQTVGAAPFQIGGSTWNNNALTPSFGQGDPATFTWSIVPDGTSITAVGSIPGESNDPSGLINFLDVEFNVPVGDRTADLESRSWFSIFSDSFDRFAQLSGLSYRYEPNDDGNTQGGINQFTNPTGQVGVRGDVRIGGHSIDGGSGPNVLAYNYFPEHGDMVLDTDNGAESQFGSDTRFFRNVVMHEHGHGLGLRHVEPVNQTKLMEPFISTAYYGPQIDDIQAIQRLFGDVYEKSNSGAGNDEQSLATPLGAVGDGQTVSIGTDGADTGAAFEVLESETDFISIDDNSDTDWLSFSIASLAEVDLLLTPVGGAYANRAQDSDNSNNFTNSPIVDFTSQSNLSLLLFDEDENFLDLSTSGGLGDPESLTGLMLEAGTYYARIIGSANTVQLYQFDVTARFVPEPATVSMLACGLLGVVRRRR